jgi:peptidoglycan/LPS O-acetylase OafA/YrhL
MPTPPPRLAGLDLLRLLAIACVTLHHLLSITHHDHGPSSCGVNFGDVGVGLFCAVAGFLAAQPAACALPPPAWLCRRVLRLWPAYWIALAVSFALTLGTRYKPVSAPLALAQFAAVAPFFYPRDQLVNQSTWFVWLILLCYGLFFLARVVRFPRLVLLACAVLVALVWRQDPLAKHILTFCLAACLGLGAPSANSRITRAKPYLAVGLGLLFATAILISPLAPGHPGNPAAEQGLLALTGVCLLTLGVVLAWAPPEPRALRIPAAVVYEYFLIHGIFFVAAAHFFPAHAFLAQFSLAIPAAAVAAGALHYAVGPRRWFPLAFFAPQAADPGLATGPARER